MSCGNTTASRTLFTNIPIENVKRTSRAVELSQCLIKALPKYFSFWILLKYNGCSLAKRVTRK